MAPRGRAAQPSRDIEQLQTPTMGVTINKVNNNRTTALEWTAAQATRGLNAPYWQQTFALLT